MTSGRRSALGPVSTDRGVLPPGRRYSRYAHCLHERALPYGRHSESRIPDRSLTKTFKSNSNSRLIVEGARSPPRAVLDARRSHLYFSIRIGEISSISL